MDLPACYGGGSASGRVVAGSGESGVANGGAGRDRCGQLQDGDIVVDTRVAGVDGDLRYGSGDASGSPGLSEQSASFSLHMSFQTRATYKTSSANANARCRLALSAVSGGDDGVGVQQRTTAEVGSTRGLHTDDEGELAGSSGSSTNNLHLKVLGDGSRV